MNISLQHPKCNTCRYYEKQYNEVLQYGYYVVLESYNCKFHESFYLVQPNEQYCSEYEPRTKGGKHEAAKIR